MLLFFSLISFFNSFILLLFFLRLVQFFNQFLLSFSSTKPRIWIDIRWIFVSVCKQRRVLVTRTSTSNTTHSEMLFSFTKPLFSFVLFWWTSYDFSYKSHSPSFQVTNLIKILFNPDNKTKTKKAKALQWCIFL